MPHESNPAIHFVPCDIDIEFDGVTYTITARSALEWMTTLLDERLIPCNIFPILAGGEAVIAVEDAIWDGKATPEQVNDLAMDVVSVAGDRDWWETVRYLNVLHGAWDTIGSSLVARGADPAKMSLAGWVDLIRYICIQHCDPKKLAGFLGQIEAPPKGAAAAVNFDAEEKAFEAAMRSVM